MFEHVHVRVFLSETTYMIFLRVCMPVFLHTVPACYFVYFYLAFPSSRTLKACLHSLHLRGHRRALCGGVYLMMLQGITAMICGIGVMWDGVRWC